MITQRQWDKLHKFEHKEKESFLKNRLTINRSLKILKDLYLFAQKINKRGYYKKLDAKKIHILSRVHFMFMRVRR